MHPFFVAFLYSGGQMLDLGTLPGFADSVAPGDHRRIKQRIRPMLGFKRFETAAVTIRGVELAEKIKKEQFNH